MNGADFCNVLYYVLPEGAGLHNTEAACALMMLAGYVSDTQVIDHEVTRRNMVELDKRFINDLFAQMSTTAKPN